MDEKNIRAKEENVKSQPMEHTARDVDSSPENVETIRFEPRSASQWKKEIFFWCIAAWATFFIIISVKELLAAMLMITTWSITLYIVYCFAYKKEYNWTLVIGVFVVVTMFAFFMLPAQNDKDENASVNEDMVFNEELSDELHILEKLKERSMISFEEIKEERITDFGEDGNYTTYEGRSVMARNVDTDLIQKEVHAFFIDEGFEIANMGGVGGMQSLGGEVFVRDTLTCRTMYGRGSTTTGLTVSCAELNMQK